MEAQKIAVDAVVALTDCDREAVIAFIRRLYLAGVTDPKRLTFKGLQALSRAGTDARAIDLLCLDARIADPDRGDASVPHLERERPGPIGPEIGLIEPARTDMEGATELCQNFLRAAVEIDPIEAVCSSRR